MNGHYKNLQVPYPLDLEPRSRRVVIGPRTQLLVSDTADQTITAGIIATVTSRSGTLGSVPAFATPGTDILLAADEAIYLEEMHIAFKETDTAGALQIFTASLDEAFGSDLVLDTNPDVYPYIFPPVSGVATIVRMNIGASVRLLRPNTSTAAGAFKWFFQSVAYIKNTDVGASHTYQRFMSVTYRKIQGLQPLLNLIVEDAQD